MTLLSYSLVIDRAHDVFAPERCMTVAFPPLVIELYAGVNVYQFCPSTPSAKWGRKKYG